MFTAVTFNQNNEPSLLFEAVFTNLHNNNIGHSYYATPVRPSNLQILQNFLQGTSLWVILQQCCNVAVNCCSLP